MGIHGWYCGRVWPSQPLITTLKHGFGDPLIPYDREIISLVQFNVLYRSMVLFLFEQLINFPWIAVQVMFNVYKKNIWYLEK